MTHASAEINTCNSIFYILFIITVILNINMKILCALLYILVNPYTLSHLLASKVDSNHTNIHCSSGSEDVKGIMTFINMPLHTPR